jgi:hypothetical protein
MKTITLLAALAIFGSTATATTRDLQLVCHNCEAPKPRKPPVVLRPAPSPVRPVSNPPRGIR